MIALSTWAKPLRKKNGAHVAKRGARIMLMLLGIPPKLIGFVANCVHHVFPQMAKVGGRPKKAGGANAGAKVFVLWGAKSTSNKPFKFEH